MCFARANTAPTDSVQIIPVEQPPQRGHSLSLIAVDVIQRRARIKAGAHAELQALAQPGAEGSHHPARQCIPNGLKGKRKQRVGQGLILALGGAVAVRLQQRRFAPGLGEGVQNEAAGGAQRQMVILLVERIVEKARIDVHLLHGRTQPLEKLALNILIHHPVRPGGQHQSGRGNRRRVFHQLAARVV